MIRAAEKRSIRIIKRQELELLELQTAGPPNHSKTENQSRREIVQAIASWIEERREMKKALPRLRSPVL